MSAGSSFPRAAERGPAPGERNRTTARDQVTVLGRLVRGELLDPAHTSLALSILSRQHFRDLLARHVPRGEDGEPLYRVASKSGELTGVRHDVGVLFTPRPLVVALLSEGAGPARAPRQPRRGCARGHTLAAAGGAGRRILTS